MSLLTKTIRKSIAASQEFDMTTDVDYMPQAARIWLEAAADEIIRLNTVVEIQQKQIELLNVPKQQTGEE